MYRDAEANREKETRAAINIQRLFRGQFVRTTIAIKRSRSIYMCYYFMIGILTMYLYINIYV
jgi:hypothetical protein